jgi:hypothetical protein
MKRLLYILFLLTMTSCTPEAELEPLYHHYAARPNLTVAQVTGFQLNDTVKTDVVILVADDTAAWNSLKQEFDIRTSEGVTSWMGSIGEPQKRVRRNERPAWRAMAVHADRIIAFYRIDSEEQRKSLIDFQINAQTEQSK